MTCKRCGETIEIETDEEPCYCDPATEPGVCWSCMGTGVREVDRYECGCQDDDEP